MNNTLPFPSSLPRKGIAIISGYVNSQIKAYVGAYKVLRENSLEITFPKGHAFKENQAVTIHLDNRTGVSEYDADLRVYRTSYRGNVKYTEQMIILVEPREYQLYYSDKCIEEYTSPLFKYDEIKEYHPLPETPATEDCLDWNDKEKENKLGVLISRTPSRPHTSLMAFLSNTQDDIFLITFRNLFKSRALHYDNRCCFAIDHRAEFVFEKAYDWNYTIIEAEAYGISESNPLFKQIQYHFVMKNPWESSFFLSPDIEMFHLKPGKILLPDTI